MHFFPENMHFFTTLSILHMICTQLRQNKNQLADVLEFNCTRQTQNATCRLVYVWFQFYFFFFLNFDFQLHMVHFNSKYGSLPEAADKPDGLSVLGFFIEVGLFCID